MDPRTQVLVADDHPLFRGAMTDVIRSRPDLAGPLLERFHAMIDARMPDKAHALMSEWSRLVGPGPLPGEPPSIAPLIR